MKDRNDLNYFKRITKANFDAELAEYEVPENIRKRTALIVQRFSILPGCMYVANCIGYDNGTGDGQGHFREGEITEVRKIVRFLMGAYGLYPDEKDDLTEIVRTGTLSKDRMITGLRNSIQHRKEEIAHVVNDVWRVEYLHGMINLIRDSITDVQQNGVIA